MQYFDAAAIRARLPWPRMLAALDAMLHDEVAAPLRSHHSIEVPGEPAASLLLMPAWRTARRLGVKLVTVFPGNARRGQSAVGAVYALFDAGNGAALALFDGEEITRAPHGGRLGVCREPACPQGCEASRHRRIGTHRAGARRRALLRPADRAGERLEPHRSPMRARPQTSSRASGIRASAVDNLEHAVREADIVSCATLSTAPLVRGEWLRSGVHLDLVGAFRADMRETDDAALANADVIVVDRRDGALREGGDVVQAIRSGALAESRIAADLADLARGRHPGRTRAGEITVFKSVGFALEDLAAAEAVFDAADVTAADTA